MDTVIACIQACLQQESAWGMVVLANETQHDLSVIVRAAWYYVCAHRRIIVSTASSLLLLSPATALPIPHRHETSRCALSRLKKILHDELDPYSLQAVEAQL